MVGMYKMPLSYDEVYILKSYSSRSSDNSHVVEIIENDLTKSPGTITCSAKAVLHSKTMTK